jgi:hypothetical protein
MIIKYVYDVVYDSLELLEEGGHTYYMDANQIYKDLVEQGKITTIVSRAPTHEPYPYHNLGVPVTTTLSGDTTDQTNTTLPPGFSISRGA